MQSTYFSVFASNQIPALPVNPVWHFSNHHSAAPGQQVPLSGHLTTQGIMLHLPNSVHLSTSVCRWTGFSSWRGGHNLCFIS